ncbi:Peptidyl-tRNA hydrolase, chloroplastic [Zostera marina]|uniref:peptidyl-tRNA hydrolase n=1 Tax=Zostera marina TaxID=29655 RepID=A0A0K9PMK1_ZOSMR|nr:Peptidyl-tRNA hydrolase, chloroplastic [Zostera marina]
MLSLTSSSPSIATIVGIRTIRFPIYGMEAAKTLSFTTLQLQPSASASSMTLSAVRGEQLVESRPKPKPWLLVGLGNPGKMYRGTRHNVGFDMLDAIACAEGISVGTTRFKALFGKGFIDDVPVILAKPQTFMNASGESVSQFVSYYDIPISQVLVMYDDLDLPFASLKMLPKGGHGGHNGMRNIIDRLKGNRDFPRLRIGIGRPPGKMDPVNFVLRAFNKNESNELNFTFQMGANAVRLLTKDGFDKSAKYVNTKKSLPI